jgi:hypothetical protein
MQTEIRENTATKESWSLFRVADPAGTTPFGDTSAFYDTYLSSSRSGGLGVEMSLELYKRTQS